MNLTMMTKKVLIAGLLFCMMAGKTMAQDEPEITDEDLYKYALMMQVVDYMKKDISAVVNQMIKDQEGMTGQRYLELMKAKKSGDMASVDAKEFEIKFIDVVEGIKDERKDAIKTVVSELATKMVGERGKTYKAIKAMLAEDEDLKARYDAILAQVSYE